MQYTYEDFLSAKMPEIEKNTFYRWWSNYDYENNCKEESEIVAKDAFDAGVSLLMLLKQTLENDNRVLEKKAFELEKENEELKEELTKKADTNHSLVEQMSNLEMENAELKELKKKKEEIEIMTSFCKTCKKLHIDRLTKAKEILQRVVKWATTETGKCEKFDFILADTKQFLKEIE